MVQKETLEEAYITCNLDEWIRYYEGEQYLSYMFRKRVLTRKRNLIKSLKVYPCVCLFLKKILGSSTRGAGVCNYM